MLFVCMCTYHSHPIRVKKNLILLTKGKVGNEMYKNEKTYNKNRQKMKNTRKWGYAVNTPIKFYRPTILKIFFSGEIISSSYII